MKELIMSGVQIGNELQFCKYFSPTDLLRQRELAAGFAAQVMSPLSLGDSYHSQQLYRAVFQTLPQQVQDPQDYGQDACSGILTDAHRAFLEDLWDLLELGGEARGDDLKRFWILASGYFLSGNIPERLPVTKQELLDAYDRKLPPRVEPDWPDSSGGGDIALPAREKPYILHLDIQKGAEWLAGGAKLISRRLDAVNRQGLSNAQVVLEVRDGGSNPYQLQLAPGDYLYCNFVGDVPVYLHPTRVSCGDWTLSRQGNELILEKDGEEQERMDCTGREIISLAPDGQGGWLLLERGGLNDTHYSGRTMNDAFLWYAQNVVEAAVLEDGTLMLLDEEGRISSTHPQHAAPTKKRFPSLQAAPGRKGEHGHDK